MTLSQVPHDRVILAFALVSISAVFSILGALIPIVDQIYKLQLTSSRTFVSGSFGFASGLLLFLSFADLYPESIKYWNQQVKGKFASLIVVSVIMAGFAIIWVLQSFLPNHHHHHIGEEELNKPDKGDDSDALDTSRMGQIAVQLGIGLALHNIPEGLATFVLTISNARIGILFGVAVALHKLPEGFVIALPMYCYTGSHLKAFLFAALLNSIAQFSGALLAYVMLMTYWTPAVAGSMFAIAIPILVWTVVDGMMPMAYECKGRIVSYSVAAGVFFYSFANAIFAIVD